MSVAPFTHALKWPGSGSLRICRRSTRHLLNLSPSPSKQANFIRSPEMKKAIFTAENRMASKKKSQFISKVYADVDLRGKTKAGIEWTEQKERRKRNKHPKLIENRWKFHQINNRLKNHSIHFIIPPDWESISGKKSKKTSKTTTSEPFWEINVNWLKLINDGIIIRFVKVESSGVVGGNCKMRFVEAGNSWNQVVVAVVLVASKQITHFKWMNLQVILMQHSQFAPDYMNAVI